MAVGKRVCIMCDKNLSGQKAYPWGKGQFICLDCANAGREESVGPDTAVLKSLESPGRVDRTKDMTFCESCGSFFDPADLSQVEGRRLCQGCSQSGKVRKITIYAGVGAVLLVVFVLLVRAFTPSTPPVVPPAPVVPGPVAGNPPANANPANNPLAASAANSNNAPAGTGNEAVPVGPLDSSKLSDKVGSMLRELEQIQTELKMEAPDFKPDEGYYPRFLDRMARVRELYKEARGDEAAEKFRLRPDPIRAVVQAFEEYEMAARFWDQVHFQPPAQDVTGIARFSVFGQIPAGEGSPQGRITAANPTGVRNVLLRQAGATVARFKGAPSP